MNNECWLEMDLYWFQGDEPADKARELFDRLEPMWRRSPSARKGLVLCVGWLFDAVLYWNGRPDDVIATCQAPTYEPWTYRRLGDLVATLRNEARSRYLDDFHVGIGLLGGATMDFPEDACAGWSGRTENERDKVHYNIKGRWFPEHPEVKDPRFGPYFFGAPVAVTEGEQVCKAASPTYGDYFADKFCSMAAVTGLDALLLRDCVFAPAYVRKDAHRTMPAADAQAFTQSFIDLFARLKAARPGLVIIGYDSGTAAMEEWRAHGFDLERVARAGNLDLWITQTWASAWQDYWPARSMGFTFQLSRVLVNLAMLAGTPCRHMFLIETFDAWEPWDSIHQYPSKVAWEVWAYSHAAVLGPEGGLGRSAGFYCSWMNRGPELLSSQTVEHIATMLDDCARDLKNEPRPGGPCLVYHREGLERLIGEGGDYCRGEAIDDWTAMLQKYGLPVLSITRSEWLAEVRADGLIVPAPGGLGEALAETLLDRLESGTPVVFMGQAALLPERMRRALGVETLEVPLRVGLPSAATVKPELAGQIGTAGLVINQRQRTLEPGGDWQGFIECLGGPVFAAHRHLPCWIWETPEWGTPEELDLTVPSVESIQTYHAIARCLDAAGWGGEAIRWENSDWKKPACFLFWRYGDGSKTVLLGNLETGVTGNSQHCISGDLGVRGDDGQGTALVAAHGPGLMARNDGGYHLTLGPHKICLFRLNV